MENRQLSVVKTLTYSDIFDHPLSLDEIYYLFNAESSIPLPEIKNVVDTFCLGSKRCLFEKNGYYTFVDRKDTITKRESSNQIVKEKINLARKTARILMKIPSVTFIGVSGAVAGGNPTDQDDIDLFVITTKGSLYTTRFLLLGLLEMIGKRRKRGQEDVRDMICLNMLIDESSISFSDKRRDLYTAREIAQIIPLFERKTGYNSFLQANDWTLSILPHATGRDGCISLRENSYLATVLTTFEPILRSIQGFFIKRHKTKEIASASFLAFHPRDVRKDVMSEYEKRLRHYIKCYNI